MRRPVAKPAPPFTKLKKKVAELMAKDGNNFYRKKSAGQYRLFYRGASRNNERIETMITTELERCLCKNDNGTYNIHDALRYSAYSHNPRADWQRLTLKYPALLHQISLYFFNDHPATNQQGIDVVIDLAKGLVNS